MLDQHNLSYQSLSKSSILATHPKFKLLANLINIPIILFQDTNEKVDVHKAIADTCHHLINYHPFDTAIQAIIKPATLCLFIQLSSFRKCFFCVSYKANIWHKHPTDLQMRQFYYIKWSQYEFIYYHWHSLSAAKMYIVSFNPHNNLIWNRNYCPFFMARKSEDQRGELTSSKSQS